MLKESGRRFSNNAINLQKSRSHKRIMPDDKFNNVFPKACSQDEKQKAKIIDDVKVAVCPECGNIEMYLEDLTNLKD